MVLDRGPGGLEPLAGGWSGETFVAEVAGERTVVRIFADPRHGPHAAEVQASLLRLVRGLLPVPEVLEVRPADAYAGTPGVLVTSFLPGVRGDLHVARPDADLGAAGRAAGAVAARLAAMPLLHRGLFVGADLRVEPFGVGTGAGGTADWVEAHRESLVARGWGEDLLAGLDEVAAAADLLLGAVARASLVHSDLNPKNLLLDPTTGAVTGVVDWEFAHAGHPYTDLGNLLRSDRDPRWVEGVLDAWSQQHGTADGAPLELARHADLVALVDLAAGPGRSPVAEAARRQLRAVAAGRDVHAV
ncbi:phosphotransferase [Nocardioides zeae]|uniref:Phosphotransferase n=1 Tax=Nocardioides imazamoxiresistens TaxID=3231893 RepID=A0ABU3Q1Z4_9ACTN|nr:phosphotransferase [Nocardioides zeae]MDT9595161.1 phosphotransferase [Nocardioides zeae]